MNYPTAPLYETIKEARRPVPFSNPRSVQGYNDGHGYVWPAAWQTQEKIATKYECPLCSNYLLPPIYQCYEGHPVCNDCEAKVKRCPTCHGDLPKKKRKIRSLVLEEIVEGSRFSCRNHLLGCPVKDLRCDQIKHHTSTCPFTEIPYCEQLGINCREKCWTGNLIDHLRYKHGIIGATFSSNSHPVMEVMQSVPGLTVKSVACAPYYLEWENQIFIIKTSFSYQENCCSWMVCRVGSMKTGNNRDSNKDFIPSIKLSCRSESADAHLQQINSLSWRGLTGTLATPFGYNRSTFRVPLQMLKMYSTGFKDTRGVPKSTWSIEIRLQKQNQTLPQATLPRQMRLHTQLDTDSILTNTLAVNEEDFLMGLSHRSTATAARNEISNEIKKSPPPPLLLPPLPGRLVNFNCDNRTIKLYPVL